MQQLVESRSEPGVDDTKPDKVIMDAIYKTRNTKMYHATCFVGLDAEFMVRLIFFFRRRRKFTTTGY